MRIGALWAMIAMATAVSGAETKPKHQEEIISYSKLLEWVVDLQRLATPPPDGLVCGQFSSYDRRSTIDPQTGEKQGWKANNDAGNFIRKDPEGYVMAEMKGPGCIVRIWSANPKGELLFFIDDRKEPVWKVDFVSLVEGKYPPFTAPMVGYHGRGANCFIPIPYQRNCKVVATEPGFYYHVNYVTFPDYFVMPWFTIDMESSTKADVAMTNDFLAEYESINQEAKLWFNNESGKIKLESGKTKDVTLVGPGAIQSLRFKVTPDKAANMAVILRETILRITWDEGDKPAVEVPLGDFFGSAPGFYPYKSVPMGIDGEWFYSNWFSPFTRAKIQFINTGKHQATIEWKVGWSPVPQKKIESLLRLHAKWRSETPATEFDWPIIECTGPGWFVGCMLSVWNPDPEWWGEGDEKVYVDGETFPSWFGTGSEDYFGDAWGHRVFQHGLHNCTRRDQDNHGLYTSINRWHLSDAIPFQKTYRMTIENYDNNKDYTTVAYWYAPRDAKDFFKPIRPEQLTIRPYQEVGFKAFDNAIEFTDMKITEKPEYPLTPQATYPFMSKGSHLFGRPTKAEATATMIFSVPDTAKYDIKVHLTKSYDYGQYDLLLDGKPLVKDFDGYSPTVVPSGPIAAGIHELTKGNHTIQISVTGKNENSKGYYFGLDCIQLIAEQPKNRK